MLAAYHQQGAPSSQGMSSAGVFSTCVVMLCSFDAEDCPSTQVLGPVSSHSRLLSALPEHVLQNLQDYPIAMENHQAGAASVRAHLGTTDHCV